MSTAQLLTPGQCLQPFNTLQVFRGQQLQGFQVCIDRWVYISCSQQLSKPTNGTSTASSSSCVGCGGITFGLLFAAVLLTVC